MVARNRSHRSGMWQRGLVVAATTVLVLGGHSPAAKAAAQANQTEEYRVVGALKDVSPEVDAYRHDRPIAPPPADRAVGVVLSLGSMMLNTVLFPVKFAVGVAGAELGGVAGAMTGGDSEAAAGIWNVTTDGSYGVTPGRLDGRHEYEWVGTPR